MDILFVHQLQSKWAGKRSTQFALQSGDELFLTLVWNGANKMLLSAWALNVDIQDWRLKFYSSINATVIGNRKNFFSQFSKLILHIHRTYTHFRLLHSPCREKKVCGIFWVHNVNLVIAAQGLECIHLTGVVGKSLSLSACTLQFIRCRRVLHQPNTNATSTAEIHI